MGPASLLLAAIALDILIGDPRNWPHPARMAGFLCLHLEAVLRRIRLDGLLGGLLLHVLVNGLLIVAWIILHRVAAHAHSALATVLDVFVVYQCIALRDLDSHLRDVYRPLARGDLTLAREALSRVVGRDVDRLDGKEISRAAIETIAESTVDAVIGPALWTLLLGVPGALLFRTSNTLDSLIGHRNERYERFGKCAARFDDALAWLPARVFTFIGLLAGGPAGLQTIRQEAAQHASPNAGLPESLAAWQLNVRLGGTNFYKGEPVDGPIFNPDGNPPTAATILLALDWMWKRCLATLAVLILISAIARLA
jgi:adenosylcobinamide-phosphate synthase